MYKHTYTYTHIRVLWTKKIKEDVLSGEVNIRSVSSQASLSDIIQAHLQ